MPTEGSAAAMRSPAAGGPRAKRGGERPGARAEQRDGAVGAGPPVIDAYVAALPEPARARVAQLCALVREEAPEATERIAYGMPTWRLRENLVHVAGYAGHVGVYPGPAAIEAFADALAGYPSSKGAIRLPHELPLPVELVRALVRWRLARAR
jgi:uncharacterized protein YdhG (YjbR/CyaY superfamily)